VRLQPLSFADVPASLRLWNGQFRYDQVSQPRFIEVFLSGPSYDPVMTPALFEGDRLLGFASAVIVGTVAHLRGLVAADGDLAVLNGLLASVIAPARERGCQSIRAVTMHGNAGYVYAVIDLRYAGQVAWYESQGFTRAEEIKDMRVDLAKYDFGGAAGKKMALLAEQGIEIAGYAPWRMEAMRRFVPAAEVPHWFPDGWERTWPAAGVPVLIAVERDEILGYAEMRTSGTRGEFGPTAVRLDRREQGIGAGLLLTAMRRMRETGAREATASWVWPVELYAHNGWLVDRVFAVFEKRIEIEGSS